MSSESDEQFLDRLEATPRYNPAYRTLDSDRLFAIARRGAAIENHGQDAKPSEVSSRWEWPEGFFKIERSIMDRCASDRCGQVPSIRMERDGIGSNYCEPCARKIAEIVTRHPLPPPPEGETRDE